jgi:hypothetical protein
MSAAAGEARSGSQVERGRASLHDEWEPLEVTGLSEAAAAAAAASAAVAASEARARSLVERGRASLHDEWEPLEVTRLRPGGFHRRTYQTDFAEFPEAALHRPPQKMSLADLRPDGKYTIPTDMTADVAAGHLVSENYKARIAAACAHPTAHVAVFEGNVAVLVTAEDLVEMARRLGCRVEGDMTNFKMPTHTFESEEEAVSCLQWTAARWRVARETWDPMSADVVYAALKKISEAPYPRVGMPHASARVLALWRHRTERSRLFCVGQCNTGFNITACFSAEWGAPPPGAPALERMHRDITLANSVRKIVSSVMTAPVPLFVIPPTGEPGESDDGAAPHAPWVFPPS